MRRYLTAKGLHATDVAGERGAVEVRDPEGNRVLFLPEQRAAAGHATTMEATGRPGAATTRRIIHVGWGVKSRADEDAFFQGVLGFRPYWYGGPKDDGPVQWVSLQVPDGSDWVEYMLNYTPGEPLKALGVLNHAGLGVGKVTDAYGQLLANGMPEPQAHKMQMGRDGKNQLNVFDPDQSRLEFMEWTPAGPACCSAFTAKHPTGDTE